MNPALRDDYAFNEVCESERLLHVHFLLDVRMEERCFNVELLHVEIIVGCSCRHCV